MGECGLLHMWEGARRVYVRERGPPCVRPARERGPPWETKESVMLLRHACGSRLGTAGTYAGVRFVYAAVDSTFFTGSATLAASVSATFAAVFFMYK